MNIHAAPWVEQRLLERPHTWMQKGRNPSILHRKHRKITALIYMVRLEGFEPPTYGFVVFPIPFLQYYDTS